MLIGAMSNSGPGECPRIAVDMQSLCSRPWSMYSEFVIPINHVLYRLSQYIKLAFNQLRFTTY